MLITQKEKLDAMPMEFAQKLRDEVRYAMEGVGVSTIDEICYSELCLDAGGGRCIFASFSDTGDHIEFELSLRGRGVRCNLVHGLLMLKDADFWVRSDAYPDLNGRVRLSSETRYLFDTALACVRGPRTVPELPETRTSLPLTRSMAYCANETR